MDLRSDSKYNVSYTALSMMDVSDLQLGNSVQDEDIKSEKSYYLTPCDLVSSDSKYISIIHSDKLVSLNESLTNTTANTDSENKKLEICNYDKLDEGLESKEWFLPNISRIEAERLLESLDNKPGVFLIRNSEQNKDKYWSLSILDYDTQKQRHTKHYQIWKESGSCYIDPSYTFETLDELVKFYSKNSKGLCCKLTKPCTIGYKTDFWEEDRNNIEMSFLIGSFEYGHIYIGKWRNKYKVTLKLYDANFHQPELNESKKKRFSRELEIMKQLRHDKIVKLWGACTFNEPLCIISEYMFYGNLLNYMRMGLGSCFDFNDIINVSTQIASGMRYLEGLKCVHRLLCAKNIFVGENNMIKIGNFNMAAILDENERVRMTRRDIKKLNVKWTAPEVLFYDEQTGVSYYSPKSDIWSFGILLYELITLGNEPYIGLTEKEVKMLLKYEKNYHIRKPEYVLDDDYYSILILCWDYDIEKRPSFNSIYTFFRDYFKRKK